MTILYVLVVFSLSGDTLFVDSRLMTLQECRTKRSYEILWYQVERDQDVYPVCVQSQTKVKL